MKPITKIIIFLVIAFALVIIITLVRGKTVVAPVTNTPSNQSTSSTTNGVPSASGTYTLVDVAEHKTSTDCWTTVGGNVFDLTPFVSKHPGGVPNISKICGVDGTSIFTAQHGSNENAQAVLSSLKIGTLTN